MGAGQSSDDSRNASKNPTSVKTSYYELLGVDRQATDDEIKKAYRRKALELHPDRNYGRVEETTALFAEVQSAYEVLSDPQERAWYDSHEDAILRDGDPTTGGDGGASYERNVGLTTADDITRMFTRFHGGVEFSDAPSGFYGFLRETFDNLAREEQMAARQEGLDEIDYPPFGHKADKHEDVVKTFYAAWSGFSTKKTFSWKDQYSTRGVGDRRTRRMVEKENKRFRDEAIKEFNDAVRSLVAFVKKRDPRYKPNTQSEADRQKALREATAAQAARQRAANAAKLEKEQVPEWAKTREPEDVVESEEEESEEEQFECVACRKVFKSEKQFEAHEKSKKHQKSVQALRRKLQKEGIELDLEEDDSDATEPSPEPVPTTNEDDPVTEADKNITDSVNALQMDDTSPTSKKKLAVAQDATDEVTPEDQNSEEAEAQIAMLPDQDSSNQSEDDSNQSEDDVDESTQPTSVTGHASDADTDPLAEAGSKPVPQMGKAAQKRAKKAAQNAALADQSQHKCVSCNAVFPSKTRLFQHIKDFGHAAPVSASKAKTKKGKGK